MNMFRRFTWLCPLLIASAVVNGAPFENKSPRLKNIFDYQLGGGLLAAPPTPVNTVPILEFGVGWDLNMECGEFDPDITIANQLNGLTDGFTQLMDNIIQAATGAVASLPALAIQRADPGLYDLLQQGLLQGKMDFEWAETSCEEMAAVMMGDQGFPWEKYNVNARVNEWSTQIGVSGGDAVKAKQEVDDADPSSDGSEWVCGVKKGGAAQPPIQALRDVVMVGYNVLFDRANACDTSGVAAALGQGTPMWEYWNGPVVAAQWAVDVVGDTDMRICPGCTKLESTPGNGLMYRHREMAETLYQDLEDLVNNVTQMSWQNLNRVSAPPGARIDDTIIMGIQQREPPERVKMMAKLASEIAYTRLVEQGRLLTQMLRSGAKEPNVSNLGDAVQIVHDAIDHLQVEMDQLQAEIEAREAFATKTIARLLGREERRVQEIRAPSRSTPNQLNSLGFQ